SGEAPCLRSRSATRSPSAARPTSRCSVDTYSSPISVASCWACERTLAASRENWGAATVEPLALGNELRIWSSSRRTSAGSAPTADSSGAVIPSLWASRAPSRCAEPTSGLPATVAACTAEEIACWVLVVGLNASITHLVEPCIQPFCPLQRKEIGRAHV